MDTILVVVMVFAVIVIAVMGYLIWEIWRSPIIQTPYERALEQQREAITRATQKDEDENCEGI
jgi:Flp pilus assembly protein CpaB